MQQQFIDSTQYPGKPPAPPPDWKTDGAWCSQSKRHALYAKGPPSIVTLQRFDWCIFRPADKGYFLISSAKEIEILVQVNVCRRFELADRHGAVYSFYIHLFFPFLTIHLPTSLSGGQYSSPGIVPVAGHFSAPLQDILRRR